MLCIFAGPTALKQPDWRNAMPDEWPEHLKDWWLRRLPLDQGIVPAPPAMIKRRRDDGIAVDLIPGQDLKLKPFTPSNEIAPIILKELGPLESRRYIQESKEGMRFWRMRTERPEERYYRRMMQNGLELKVIRHIYPYDRFHDPFADEPLLQKPIGYVRTWRHEHIHVSPTLYNVKTGMPLTLSDFPDTTTFGNGLTCNANVIPLADGTKRVLSWAVTAWDDEERWQDRGRLEALRQLLEA